MMNRAVQEVMADREKAWHQSCDAKVLPNMPNAPHVVGLSGDARLLIAPPHPPVDDAICLLEFYAMRVQPCVCYNGYLMQRWSLVRG